MTCKCSGIEYYIEGFNIRSLSLIGKHIQNFGHYKNNLTWSKLILNSITRACIAGPACPPSNSPLKFDRLGSIYRE